MNLLVDHGHPQAMYYPLGMLMDEAAMVQERENSRIVTEAKLLQFAVAGMLAKESRKLFDNMIKDLNIVTKPYDDDAPLERLLPEGYQEE